MIVQATDIRKSFGQLQVLKGIDFGVSEAEVVAIVGASGAGKSTLLQILGTLLTPDTGSIIIDGTPVLELSQKELAAFRMGLGHIACHSKNGLLVLVNDHIHNKLKLRLLRCPVRRICALLHLPSPL